MNRIKKVAIILRLIDKLREKGSWCGETHLQKATFFLQELMRVPTEFNFVLYKRGPFSFELRDEIASIRADGLIELEPHWPYSPRIVPSSRSKYIQDMCSKTVSKYEDHISFVARQLGSKGVTALERLATALYVTKNIAPNTTTEERAEKLASLKSHICLETAKAAIEEIEKIIEDAAKNSTFAPSN